MDLNPDLPPPPSNEEESETEILENVDIKVVETTENKPPKEEKRPVVPDEENDTPILQFSTHRGGGCSLRNPRLLFTAIISVIMILCSVILLTVPNVPEKGTNVGIVMLSSVVGLWVGSTVSPLRTKPY